MIGPSQDRLRAGDRIITWCKACGHQVEPDAAEMAERYSARSSNGKSGCGARAAARRQIDMVLTGQRKCGPADAFTIVIRTTGDR
jgi:hypothetical protein